MITGLNNAILDEFQQTYNPSYALQCFIHGRIDVSVDNDLVNILLEINIDKHLKSLSKPFADISMGSHFHDEQEVLFYIGTIFKIKMIEQKNDIWLIELDVCTDDDNNELFCQIKNEIINDQGDTGKLLLKIGEYDEAKVYYQQLLNHQQQDYRHECYTGLGLIGFPTDDYMTALDSYLKALNIKNDNGTNYMNIGNDYDQTLLNYKWALEIQLKYLSLTHPSIPISYRNIGQIYEHQNRYDRALINYTKANEIYSCHLSTAYPNRIQLNSDITRIQDLNS
ncbi:unnamed protein product [Didymodactylos carnosus]|uniref:Tetratricopeptide repeat protein n=1 Tax=Didymodactylos carnosus TaxID=1234261 RepID=A0A813WFD0_9BILA|nr:unnamed protein product [Didymodactylos carnosus]CAF3638133.1 unnamed protein product [Didymodactylos carnosus]